VACEMVKPKETYNWTLYTLRNWRSR